MNWTSAEQHCMDRFKCYFVGIHNDEFKEIKQEIISLGKESENFWIGLRNINDYYWSDGTLFNLGININGGIYPWQNYSNAPNIKYSKYIRLWRINNLLWGDVEGEIKWYWICNNNTNNQFKTAVINIFIDICNVGIEMIKIIEIEIENKLQNDCIYLINNITSNIIETDKESLIRYFSINYKKF